MHVHPTHARHILPRMYTARDLVRCTLYVAPQFSSSVVGEKHAQNKPRCKKHAQNLQALSLSLKLKTLRFPWRPLHCTRGLRRR